MLSEKAAKEHAPPDWCYVYNFRNPDAATAISMEPGQGKVLQRGMEDFLKALKTDIPKAFESKEYEKQRSRIVEEFQQKQSELFSKLDEEARQKGFTVRRGATGVLLLPLKPDGEPVTPEEFSKLDEKTKKELEKTGRTFQERLNEVFRAMRETEKFVQDMLAKLERAIAFDAVNPPVESLKTGIEGTKR